MQTAALESVLSVAQRVLDEAPFGVHLYRLHSDDRLVFVGANATADASLGVDHQQFLGKTIEEAFPALTHTEVPMQYRQVIRSGLPWHTDQVDYDEQGIRGAFEVRAVPMDDDHLAVFFNDITQRLRAAEELSRKQRDLDAYFTHALELLCIATTDGRFKRLNPEWEKTLGYPVSEVEGRRFTEYVHPDDYEKTARVLGALVTQGEVTSFVNRFRSRAGSYRSLEWRAFARDSEIYAAARDVTEHQALVEKLRASEALYHNVIETMHELLALYEVVFDAEGKPTNMRVLEVNSAWEKGLGVSRADAVGRLVTEIWDHEPPYLQAFAEVALGGPPCQFEHHDPGHHLQVSVTSPGRGLIVLVGTDITDRVADQHRLERLIRELTVKSQEMESLLYVTTHDLRSPLVNIQGFSARIERVLQELATTGDGDARPEGQAAAVLAGPLGRVRSSLGYIVGSAQKMDRLIGGLLQLSRLGREPLQPTRVDMEALWRRVVASFKHQLEEASAKIETGPVPPCFGDSKELDQVLSNLLDNALKYRDRERACVVSFAGTVEDDGTAVYRLRDTGRGIEPQEVERIWELFHRLSPRTDPPGEGIGLTTVRRILHRHGGEACVESRPGVGTTFLLRIPSKSSLRSGLEGRRRGERANA